LRRETSESIPLEAAIHVLDCAFSPDRRWLALGLEDGRVVLQPLRPLARPLILAAPGSRGIDRCAFAPTGNLLATRSRDGWLRIWEYEKQSCLARAPVETSFVPWMNQGLVGLAWRPEGHELLCPGTDGGLGGHRLEDGRLLSGEVPADSPRS
jgi:hypothetical protein